MRTNDRLSLWTAQSETENHQSALRIMEILDAAMKPSPPEEASTACLSLMPDHFDLVMVVLTWACSKSRSSIAHIYVACRIFWTWTHQARFSVRACLVGATKALQHTSTLCPAAVGRLFAELTRSGHFDLSNYLRFAASARDPSKQRQPNKRQILLQAPTAHLPMEVQTLRTQLLASRSAVDSGKDNVSAIKGKIAASLNAAFAGNMPDLSAPKLQIMLDPIPAGVLFEIGKWLRGLLLPLLTKQPKDPEAVLAYQLVELVLLLMQNVNDFAQLRDIMSALASKSGTNSLYLIALFGEAHIDVLVALGHYNKLRHAILDRYRSLRASSAAPHRVLCQLLLQSTGTGVLGVEGEQYLLREIEFCDPGIAAYTPLNDMDVDTATDEQSDLDRLLAKGPALAGEELQSALNMILHHVFHLKSNAHAQVETIRCNLQALRTANEESFMPTLTGCIRAMSEELDDIAMLRLGSVLLIDDAMEVDDLAACIDGIVAANSEVDVEDRSPLIALHTLRFFCGGVATCEEPSTSSDDLFEEWSESPSDDWKRSVIRRRLEHAHPHILVRLVVHSLRVKPCGRAGLRSLVKTPSFHGLVHRLLREQEIGFNEEMQTLLRPTPSGTADNVRVFVAVIAELSEHLQHTPTPMTAGAAESMLRYLFASVEPASLQPYKLAMSWVTSCWRQGGPSLPDTSEICYSLCRDMSSRDAQLWQQLMPSVDPEVRRQMQARAEHAVLFSPESNDALRKCLRAQWDVSPTSHTRIFNAIKLNIQLNHRPEKAQLIARHLSIATRVNGENVADGPMFLDWLRAILQLVLIYHGSSTATSTLVSLLHSLCRLFTSTKLANHPDLASLAYDMACFFAPRANDSNLALLRAHLSDLFHDERIRFLLGHEPTPEPAFEQSSNFSSIASSPAVAPLGKHNAASPSQEPTSFGVRKCDSLSRPILDRDILDTAFRVWEDYDANDKR